MDLQKSNFEHPIPTERDSTEGKMQNVSQYMSPDTARLAEGFFWHHLHSSQVQEKKSNSV